MAASLSISAGSSTSRPPSASARASMVSWRTRRRSAGRDLDGARGELAPVVGDARRRGRPRARASGARRVVSPAAMPKSSKGTTSPSSRETMPWTGRTHGPLAAPPRAWSWPRRCRRGCGARSRPAPRAVARPAIFLVAARYSPLSVVTRASWSGSRPVRLAKPSRAGVGAPSAPKAARTGGPITCSSRSGSRSGRPARISTSRRGVKPVSTSRGAMPRAISSSKTRVASSRTPGSSMRAGISSLRTSSRYSPSSPRGIGHLRRHRPAVAASPWSSGKPSCSRLST